MYKKAHYYGYYTPLQSHIFTQNNYTLSRIPVTNNTIKCIAMVRYSIMWKGSSNFSIYNKQGHWGHKYRLLYYYE